MLGLEKIYLLDNTKKKEGIFSWENILFALLLFFQFFIYLSGGHETESVIPQWVSLPIEMTFLMYVLYLCFSRRSRFSIMTYYILGLTALAAYMGYMNGGSITINMLTSFMIITGCLMTQISEEKIFKFLFVISIVGVAFVIKEFVFYDPEQTASVLLERGMIHDIPLFQSITLLWTFTLLLIISFVYKKYFLLAGVVWALCMVVNLMATKRLFVVQSAGILAILLFFFYMTKQRKEMKVMIILLPVMILIGISVFSYMDLDYNELLEALKERSTEDAVEDTGFARFRESENYLHGASIIDIVMGKGFGVVHGGLGRETTDLHIGITNLILKYGIWMVPLFVILALRCIFSIPKLRYFYETDRWRVVCILVTLVNVPQFCTVANFFTLSPNTTFFWYCLIRSTYTPKKNAIPVSGKI